MRLSFLTTLLLSFAVCQAQDFDRALEKNIKTEINLNRIAKSQNPLQLSSFYKAAADSLNALLYKAYIENSRTDSRGEEINAEKMWSRVREDWQSKHGTDFDSYHAIIKDGDYAKALKEDLFKDCSIYTLSESEVSISVIRHGKQLILTAVTW